MVGENEMVSGTNDRVARSRLSYLSFLTSPPSSFELSSRLRTIVVAFTCFAVALGSSLIVMVRLLFSLSCSLVFDLSRLS